MVVDDHPTLAGRRGRIIASDLANHEFEVEFHRSKAEKIVNKTNTMRDVNDDDTYDLLYVDTDARPSFTRLKISAYDLALPEIASSKGMGRSNKKAKNNKSVSQSLRPVQCTLNIEEDEAHNIHGFGMVVRASTLNELAGLKDSEILEHRLSEIMKERDEEEEAAKALEEQKEQATIRETEEREKQEIAKRFRQHEKEINGRRKKARRILSSGKSKFVKGLKTKPEPPEKLYYDSDSLSSSIHNGFVDLLVTLHEVKIDEEACALMEAIEEAEFSPNAVEYDESSETTRTCFLFEDDNHKIPLCIVDYKFQQAPDSREIPSSMDKEVDIVMNSIMEQCQYDELCSETGLRKGDALTLVHTLIQIEKDSDTKFDLPPRVVKRFIRHDLLDEDFVQEILSRDDGSDQARLFLRAVSQRLSVRLSFDLVDLVRKLVYKMDRDGLVSDSDHDSDDSNSIEWGRDHMRQLSDIIDLRALEKFCKVTGLCRQDALNLVVHYVAFVSEGEAVAQELLDKLPARLLGNLVRSGFFDHDFIAEILDTNGGFMSGEMFLTLVNDTLESRFWFSLSDLLLVNQKAHYLDEVTDDEDGCFDELSSDDDGTDVGSDEEDIGDDDDENIDDDEDDSDVDGGDDDDDNDDDSSHTDNGNDEEISEDDQPEATV